MNIIIINKIISFLWNDKLLSYKWKLSLSLVSKQFFQLISRNYFTTVLPYTLKTKIESHIESPFCLLKYVRYLDLELYYSTSFEFYEKYSTFFFSNTESLVLRFSHPREVLIKLNHFLKSFSSLLINLRELSINDIPSTDGNEVMKILTEDHLSTFTNQLESLIIHCNSRKYRSVDKRNHLISDAKFNNLKNLTLTGYCDDILYTPNIIKNLTTIKLGIPLVSFLSSHFEGYMLKNPDQFFNLLSENKVIERLDLFLYNRTDFIDYKPSFFKYLERNQTLTSLSLGFIRDIKYLEIIKSKINIKHLRITMNEPIVFNQLESLHLSARNDKFIYHQLIALRESFNNNGNEFKLKKLSLKFIQYRVDTACEILDNLPFILKDLETIRSLSIEYTPMIIGQAINGLVQIQNIEELHIISGYYEDLSSIYRLLKYIKPIFDTKSICFEYLREELDYIKKTSAVHLIKAIHKYHNTVVYYRTRGINSQDEYQDESEENGFETDEGYEDETEEDFWNGEYEFDETDQFRDITDRNIGIEGDDDYDNRETHSEQYDKDGNYIY